MEESSLVPVSIAEELYHAIDEWRLELCKTYNLIEIDMDTFITFLLTRSHIDVTILLWHLPEGLEAFKDFRKLNDN